MPDVRKSSHKPSDLEIKALEAADVANKESNQCVPPHVTPVPTCTYTYVYHQGHITSQDVGILGVQDNGTLSFPNKKSPMRLQLGAPLWC